MWDPKLLSITITSNMTDCVGTADPYTQTLFSSECGELEHRCDVPFNFEFNIYFHVDVQGDPRPRPYTPPELSIDLKFIDSNGGLIDHIEETDDGPSYGGVGDPLVTTFGTNFSISTTKSLTLQVYLEMNDIDTGEQVIYSDTIECNIIPCEDDNRRQ